MDHIYALLGQDYRLTVVPHFTVVPYICDGWTYHTGQFESLGSEYGLETVDSLLKLRGDDPKRFRCIVQSWLYFDLLKNFFPDVFRLGDFVKETEDGQIVSSEILIEYCSKSTQYSESNHKEKHRVLQFATSLVDRLDEWKSDESPSEPQTQSQLIVCSGKVLVDTLSSLLHCFCPTLSRNLSAKSTSLAAWADDRFTNLFYPGNVRSGGGWTMAHDSRRVSLRDQSMSPAAAVYLVEFLRQDKKWCPNRLNKMSHQLDSTCLYLFAIMDHDIAIDREGHEKCSQTCCKKDNLSSEEYKTKHAAFCRSHNCGLVSVNEKALDTIYQAGSRSTTVPILKCTADGAVQVQESGSHKYYAISHVWSEGLGNKDANAIYRCQLRDIMEQVRQTRQAQNFTDQAPNSTAHAQDPMYIWLDTLCIPPSGTITGASGMSSKKLAIQRIDCIFAAATSVIVRDKSLQNERVDFFEAPPLQQAMYLYNMTWLTRCWTLAEGIGAWEIHVPIRGRSVNLHECIESIKPAEDYTARHEARSDDADVEGSTSPILNLRNCIIDHAIACLLSPFEALSNGKLGEMDLSQTWNALLDRSTTRSEDIPGILAVANAISPKEVVLHAVEDRIKAVLNAFQELPAAFLFNVGPKFDDDDDNPHNRWVPVGPKFDSDKDELHNRRVPVNPSFDNDDDDPHNRWVHGELSVGAWRITSSETLTTYQEGKLVGPLCTDIFPTYFFTGKVSDSFHLNMCQPGELGLHQLSIKLIKPSKRAKDITRWCLVLPSSFIPNGFCKTSSCIAFWAEVQRGCEKTSKILVRWETLAKVQIIPSQQSCCARPTQDASKALKKSKLYIACGTYPNMK